MSKTDYPITFDIADYDLGDIIQENGVTWVVDFDIGTKEKYWSRMIEDIESLTSTEIPIDDTQIPEELGKKNGKVKKTKNKIKNYSKKVVKTSEVLDNELSSEAYIINTVATLAVLVAPLPSKEDQPKLTTSPEVPKEVPYVPHEIPKVVPENPVIPHEVPIAQPPEIVQGKPKKYVVKKKVVQEAPIVKSDVVAQETVAVDHTTKPKKIPVVLKKK